MKGSILSFVSLSGFLLLSCQFSFLFGQQNFLPISDYYKDQLFAPHSSTYRSSSFLPVSEGQFDLQNLIRDSSKQYYPFTEVLFKQHLFTVTGDGYKIVLSPLVNATLSKEEIDTSTNRLFDNTRGFVAEIDIKNRLSLSTSYFENQNRFSQYETFYYEQAGERIPQADSSYFVDHAVVPGATRTKPFKEDGFDYGYAIGNVVFKATEYWRLSFGNNHAFVGPGYRSMFYSDNSVASTYLRSDLSFKKWDFTTFRSKQFNLLRRPFRTTVEAYFEPKLFSSQFLTYRLNKSLSFSLFEGSYWSVGDSVTSVKVNPAYYSPIPVLSHFLESDATKINTLTGFQFEYRAKEKALFYGQYAVGNYHAKDYGTQLGVRIFNLLNFENQIQIEYNHASANLYSSPNSRLSYSNYNLASAHPMGQGFDELVVRLSAQYQRWYVDVKWNYYQLNDYSSGDLIASNSNLPEVNGNLFHQYLEVGYRFNKKINLQLFGASLLRQSTMDAFDKTNILQIGLRTGLLNHYRDI